jgi:DNA-directed RNA polymerase subunit RPC12/RpoP
LQSGASISKDIEEAPLTDSVPGTPPEKMKFRCLGCGALLSVAPVSKKSFLTCPQCKTQMFIEANGTVTPAHAGVSATPSGSGRHKPASPTASAPPGFDKKELDKMLDMGAGEAKHTSEDTNISQKPQTESPRQEPATVPRMQKEEQPQKQPLQPPQPRLKIQRPSKLDQYKKISSGLPSAKENKVLIVVAAVLILLPAILAFIVDSEMGESIKAGLSKPAQTLKEGFERISKTTSSSEDQKPKEELQKQLDKSPKEENPEQHPSPQSPPEKK